MTGMLRRMSATQLAIRFSDRQIETLDALAAETQSTRSAVVKRLVDDAERARIAALYAAAYPSGRSTQTADGFGDLHTFHDAAEQERVESRTGTSSW